MIVVFLVAVFQDVAPMNPPQCDIALSHGAPTVPPQLIRITRLSHLRDGVHFLLPLKRGRSCPFPRQPGLDFLGKLRLSPTPSHVMSRFFLWRALAGAGGEDSTPLSYRRWHFSFPSVDRPSPCGTDPVNDAGRFGTDGSIFTKTGPLMIRPPLTFPRLSTCLLVTYEVLV